MSLEVWEWRWLQNKWLIPSFWYKSWMEDLIGEFCTSAVLPFCSFLFLSLLVVSHLIPLLSRRNNEPFVEKEQNVGSRTDFFFIYFFFLKRLWGRHLSRQTWRILCSLFRKGNGLWRVHWSWFSELDTMGRSEQRRRGQIRGRGKRIKCPANIYIVESISNLTWT